LDEQPIFPVRSAEFGVWSERPVRSSTPHSAFRTPHWGRVAGLGVEPRGLTL